MLLAEKTTNITSFPQDPIDPNELKYIAFSGQNEIAHGIFRSIPKERRERFANKFILSEVVAGGVKKLKKFLAASAEVAANEEKEFISETVDLFVRTSRNSGSSPRELFESLLLWADELTKLSLLKEAMQYYDQALDLGINKFPELYVRCLFGKGSLLNLTGKFRETQSLLSSLAERPYLIADRNLLPELMFNLGKESLLKGDVSFYKKILFRGLRLFYTRIEIRKQFVNQIRTTYRHSHNVLLDGEITLENKLLFCVHRFYFLLERFGLTRRIGLARLLRPCLLAYVYGLNYVFQSSALSPEELSGSKTRTNGSLRFRRGKNILITRAMGGIGDLLMMTPGFHALKKKNPSTAIHLAIPRRYFPLFQGNTDVTLVDIEVGLLDVGSYKKWFNFTDCPAARVESRTAPKVKKSRIELFAHGMGVRGVRKMAKRPRYVVLPEEQVFQQAFWSDHGLESKTVIGVQLHSDEVYRDYPHMEQLVDRLSKHFHVLVFDSEPIHEFDGENITKVSSLPMRKAFALAGACDVIVAPDSAFVHLAAALDVPCIGLYGPVDGEVRTMHYPKCTYLDVRKRLGCMPCWRNDKILCKLTNMRTSVCMADISITEIHAAVNDALQKEKKPMKTMNKLCDAADWFRPEIQKIIESELREVPRFHRKQWESAMIFLALQESGKLSQSNLGLSMGGGKELIAYAVAPHVKQLVITDLYDPNTIWDCAKTDDPDVYIRQNKPFPVDDAKLKALRMDMRDLRFPEKTFDFCYSTCAVEHIGDRQDFLRHFNEVAKVLKDDGVYVFTTEVLFDNKTIRDEQNYIFSLSDLNDILAESDLEIDEEFDAHITPHKTNYPVPATLRQLASFVPGNLAQGVLQEAPHIQLLRGQHPFTCGLFMARKRKSKTMTPRLRVHGLEQTQQFATEGVRQYRHLLATTNVSLNPFSTLPGENSRFFADHAEFFSEQKGAGDNETVFHTEYFWFGSGKRAFEVGLRVGNGERSGSGEIEFRIHRYETLKSTHVECVASVKRLVQPVGWMMRTIEIETNDECCYAVLAKLRNGACTFDRIEVKSYTVSSPVKNNSEQTNEELIAA